MEAPEEREHETGHTGEPDNQRSPRGEEGIQQDYGNLQFGEYILNLDGVDSRLILYRDLVDDEVKATQYERQDENAVLVLFHAKWKRKGDTISWQREGVGALAFSGMVSPEGYLGGGVFKPLNFSASKKSKKWTAAFERKLI